MNLKMSYQTETDHRNLNPEGIRHRHRICKMNIFVKLLIYFWFELHKYQHLEHAILLPVSFIPYPSPFLILIFSHAYFTFSITDRSSLLSLLFQVCRYNCTHWFVSKFFILCPQCVFCSWYHNSFFPYLLYKGLENTMHYTKILGNRLLWHNLCLEKLTVW